MLSFISRKEIRKYKSFLYFSQFILYNFFTVHIYFRLSEKGSLRIILIQNKTLHHPTRQLHRKGVNLIFF